MQTKVWKNNLYLMCNIIYVNWNYSYKIVLQTHWDVEVHFIIKGSGRVTQLGRCQPGINSDRVKDTETTNKQ